MDDGEHNAPIRSVAVNPWWSALHRDRVWTEVIAGLEAYLCERLAVDQALFWLALPPDGSWLRWSNESSVDVVERDSGPGSLEARVRAAGPDGYTAVSTEFPPRCRAFLETLGIRYVRLIPMLPPASLTGEERWEAMLGLAWRDTPLQWIPDLPLFPPAVWYLLKERLERAYTEAVVDLILQLGVPASVREWYERMPSLLNLLGGEHWALYEIPDPEATPPRLSLVTEFGRMQGRGTRLVTYFTEQPEALAQSLLLQAAHFERTVFVPDTKDTPYTIPEAYGGESVRSAFILPLGRQANGAYGLLGVYWSVPDGWQGLGLSFQPWDALRRLLSEWWQTMHIARHAVEDALTGVWNRRGLAQMWESVVSHWPEGTFGVVDADRFSDVNTRWGHLVGDAALKAIAQAAQQIAQPRGGFVARWGGDEFVLCVPERCDWPELGRELQTVLDSIVHEGQIPSVVKVSGGAESWTGSSPNMEKLFAVADSKLLEAKRAGRSRFVA